jgi:hypothetical protein
MRRIGKRGQSLSINTIIIIILAILVLAIVAVGFIIGWDKIGSYIKPSNNVKEIKDACNVACATGSVYDFCTVEREIKIEKSITVETLVLVSGDKKTCEYYTSFPTLGVEKCASICGVTPEVPAPVVPVTTTP